MTERLSRRREGRRAGGLAHVGPIKPLVNQLPPYEVLTEEGVDAIHRASLRLVKEQGIHIVDFPPARETFRQNGAKVDGENVRVDEDTLLHFVRQAPATFTQLARNPANSVPIGGRHLILAPVYGPPFVADVDRGRRRATLEDFQNFAKLTYLSEHLHHNGGARSAPDDIDFRRPPPRHVLPHHTPTAQTR